MASRDPYEVVLADLRAKRDEIDNLIQSLEAFRPSKAPPASASMPIAVEQPDRPSGEVGPLFGLSIVDASKIVLRERGQPMPVADIAGALRKGGHVMNSPDPTNTVSSVLNRAFQQGNGVVRIGRGTWALAGWPSAQAVEGARAQSEPEPPLSDDEILGIVPDVASRDPLFG